MAGELTAPSVAWVGAVLCGGESRRMGRDKALLALDGEVLAGRVSAAILEAGAEEVACIGGDAVALREAGLKVVADDWPGQGPFGGLLTALRVLAAEGRSGTAPEIVFVASCDLVRPDPAAIAATVRALVDGTEADVVVPLDGEGRRQWLHAAWRAEILAVLTRQVEAGERAVHRAVRAAGLSVLPLDGIDMAAFADADRPEELPLIEDETG